jgi:hypothetical protein
MFAVTISTALNRVPAHQVHRSAKNFRKLLLHARPIQERWVRITAERGQQIHIARTVEIFTARGAKQLKPGNAAFAAEPVELFLIELQLHIKTIAS